MSQTDQLNPGARASLGALLWFAWDAEAFTSNDAMPHVGLTRSTTIEALNELVELGLVAELTNARDGGDYRKGRPSRRFEFRGDAGVVVGIDAGRAHLGVVVADLRGRALARHGVDLLETTNEALDRRRALAGSVDRALAAASRGRQDVVALCVGVPAPVTAGGDSPPHREGFWEKMNPAVKTVFEGWAPVVRVENDAALAAVAERRLGGAVGCDDFVALLAGRRLGAGVVSGGRLLRGANGGVGEMTPLNHLVGVASAEGLGDRIVKVALRALAAGVVPPDHPLALGGPARVSAQDVLALATDPALEGVVEEVGGVLARIVSLVSSMYDPERIMICGAIAEGIEPVLARARALLPADMDLPAPRLVASGLGGDVVVEGALAAALESARDRVLELVLSGGFTVRPPAGTG